MAFRKKAGLILSHSPDIVIIPECEHPDKLKFKSQIQRPDDIFWFGNNHNKGLGVFSYNNYEFQLDKIHNPAYRTVLPINVTNKKFKFTLFAIWANNPQDKGYEYIGQVWKALNFYTGLLKTKKIILAGDFNSNTIWDKPRREYNHSAVVNLLANKGVHSTYHKFFKQNQGSEEHKTLFMYRHKDKSYHIDYCFASNDFIKKIANVEVGSYSDWHKYSDHTPLIVTFNT